MKNPIELKEWTALLLHQSAIANQSMHKWFASDKQRSAKFSLQCGDLLLDYSRNRATDETISLLCNLAQTINLSSKIEALFKGEAVNLTERRPALHTALRHPHSSDIQINGSKISEKILRSREQLDHFANQIHTHQWRGITGKPITQIVTIGIGGSKLGPLMSIHALKNFATNELQFYFISSIDKHHVEEILQKLNPETTLFIISSKSFSTLETLNNACFVRDWMKVKLGNFYFNQHFIAITAHPEKALRFGFAEKNIFLLWEWVGGRYSIWSAIGLPLLLMIGPQHFNEFLEGAYEMDNHFRTQAFQQNMPVLLALLSIWYINFFNASAQAMVPYDYRLRYLIPYLQQLEMESNGKRINSLGHEISYRTGSILFGQEGCDGQHSYHQALFQGQHLIPVDFILADVKQPMLTASCLSQAQALMMGKTFEEAYDELLKTAHSPQAAKELAPHLVVPGNIPSNIISLKTLSPKNLGALLALYEHKVFVQSVIWDINAFDQWGVELGKQLLPAILEHEF